MVMNRWNEDEVRQWVDRAGQDPADRQLAAQVYASRLIGGDPALVQHGGGNTSVKVVRKDLFGRDRRVLHVKGSGRDLAAMAARFMPGVWLDDLLELRRLGHLDDGDMVNAVRCNMLDASAPNPSVEILLHAFLPHDYINHTHATAMLALADMPDAARHTQEIFGDCVVTVPFHLPGFALGKAGADIFAQNPGVEGLILLNHGHFAFGPDAKTAYELTIKHTNMVEAWLRQKRGSLPRTATRPRPDMLARGLEVLPVLRGVIGARQAEFSGAQDGPMPVMTQRAGENVAEFLARRDIATLATRGVATPDHVIRTKNLPLYLGDDDMAGGKAAIEAAVDGYISAYTAYFKRGAGRYGGKKTMLDPTPSVAWISGVGLVGIGADATAADIAADLAEQNIAAMSMGQDCGGYQPVAEADLFDMEYWPLEQAKLARGALGAMCGRVLLLTGGGGAIGLATAQAFARQGANVFLVDLDPDALARALKCLGAGHGGLALDITASGAAQRAIDACIARFGGLDILLSNAGAAWSGDICALDDAVLRKSFELNFFAHQRFAKAAARVFEIQAGGGQMLFNVSKQAVNPGKGFGAYGIPKAATFFLLRQLALELGPKGVRVNGVNADRIRSGLLDDAFIAQRARARGIDEGAYMAGNLLRREVEAHHVAEAFVALAKSVRTTAHVMTVDGGNIEAALR